VNQVMKESNCRDQCMAVYCREVCKLEDRFDGLKLHHILMRHNEAADSLARLASSRGPAPPLVSICDVSRPSIGIDGDD
jgi:hypothetical protein